jgi:hypothetical protein
LLRKIFGRNTGKAAGRRRKLRNEEFGNFHRSSNKLTGKVTGHVTYMEAMRNNKNLIRKLIGGYFSETEV